MVLGSAALVLALALLSKAGADGPLASAPLLFLGEASYAIYLAHMPAIVVWKSARAALSGGGSNYVILIGEAALLTLAIIVAGSLVHALFERPARLWVRRRSWARRLEPSRPPPEGQHCIGLPIRRERVRRSPDQVLQLLAIVAAGRLHRRRRP